MEKGGGERKGAEEVKGEMGRRDRSVFLATIMMSEGRPFDYF